jgi:TonB family protein
LTTLEFGGKLRYRSRFAGCSSRMAYPSMFGPDPAKPTSAAEGRVEGDAGSPPARSARESDWFELASTFATQGGGNLSPELSAQLALEVVLNEIVEKACLTTGATGAAVILEGHGLDGHGEMVCRASSGSNAPQLGVRLGGENGLTAECIKTRQVQRCDDAQADPRADIEASRNLGVRSVMVLPLLSNGGLAGVLEVFSSQPGAFKERDELTLEALAHRIVTNVERARQPFSVAPPGPKATAIFSPSARLEEVEPAGSVTNLSEEAGGDAATSKSVGQDLWGSGHDVVTLALAAVVVAFVVLLGTLLVRRLAWPGTAAVHGQATKLASDADLGAHTRSGPTAAGQHGAGTPATDATGGDKRNASAAGVPVAHSNDSKPAEGSLLVYENGKEIFRMPPAAGRETTSAGGTNGTEAHDGAQQASSVEPAAVESAEIVDLPAQEVEASLLHRVEPEYPAEARQEGIEGAVVLDVRIGRDGAIEDVKLVSGQPLLADAAIAAVKQWRFRGHTVNAHPVRMRSRITLNFRLQR